VSVEDSLLAIFNLYLFLALNLQPRLLRAIQLGTTGRPLSLALGILLRSRDMGTAVNGGQEIRIKIKSKRQEALKK
jgi:hypothetical protein